MKLIDLKTEHPGGWADILAALENHAGESLNVNREQGKLVVIKQIGVGDIAYKLANLEGDIAGILACEAQSELAKAGAPRMRGDVAAGEQALARASGEMVRVSWGLELPPPERLTAEIRAMSLCCLPLGWIATATPATAGMWRSDPL